MWLDSSKKKAESLTALIMNQISRGWPGDRNPPTNRAGPQWGFLTSSNTGSEWPVSIKLAPTLGTGWSACSPETHSSEQLSSMLGCHYTKGRDVHRACQAPPLTIQAPRTLEHSPGAPTLFYRFLLSVVCFCEGGHFFPVPKAFYPFSWLGLKSGGGQHLLSIISVAPEVPDTMTSWLKALLGNTKYIYSGWTWLLSSCCLVLTPLLYWYLTFYLSE